METRTVYLPLNYSEGPNLALAIEVGVHLFIDLVDAGAAIFFHPTNYRIHLTLILIVSPLQVTLKKLLKKSKEEFPVENHYRPL